MNIVLRERVSSEHARGPDKVSLFTEVFFGGEVTTPVESPVAAADRIVLYVCESVLRV